MHRGYGSGWPGDWSWVPMGLLMLLFWGSVVWLGIVLLRRVGSTPALPHAAPPPPPPGPGGRDPEQILAERLARGDIDPDDYRQRLAALRETSGPPGP